MYLRFFGFREPPFNPTPDPRFLYLTPTHREALAQLVYGVQERRGFVVLTGEVGTGKTTLVRALMRRLEGQATVAFLANATLRFDDLLEYILEDLGIGKDHMGPAQRVVALNTFLAEQERMGRNTVLVLDEAQHLDRDTLERIRLLSNFETATAKLLQVLLVGQPELQATLQRPDLRQLRQRVALQCRIHTLEPSEVRAYIRTRLRVAGAPSLDLFTEDAVKRIAAYAEGIPRVINTICDHALVLAYAEQTRRIDRAVIEEAIAYRQNGWAPGVRPRPRFIRQPVGRRQAARWLTAGLGVAAASAALVTYTTRPDSLAGLVTIALDMTRAVRDAWLP
jgi:general secretion pathway protein A